MIKALNHIHTAHAGSQKALLNHRDNRSGPLAALANIPLFLLSIHSHIAALPERAVDRLSGGAGKTNRWDKLTQGNGVLLDLSTRVKNQRRFAPTAMATYATAAIAGLTSRAYNLRDLGRISIYGPSKATQNAQRRHEYYSGILRTKKT